MSERSQLERLFARVSPRFVVRGAFFAFFVFACVQLFRFAAWARGEGPYVPRPEAPAGILPIGHYTSFFAWLKGGGWDPYLPAGLVIILAALTVSFLYKRAFCGWICPVGTVWEASGALGRRILGRNIKLPRWLDLGLRGLRYAIGAFFLYFLLRVSRAEAVSFRELPYMWVADLKILKTMTEPTFIAVAGATAVVSMFLGSVWCRYLCPLGAWYGLIGMASPCTVVRDAETCIKCGKCARACHAFVDVDRGGSVRHAECDGCMDCVRACPEPGALEPRVVGRLRMPWVVWPGLVVGTWLAYYLVARAADQWYTKIPAELFQQIINSGLLEQKTPMF